VSSKIQRAGFKASNTYGNLRRFLATNRDLERLHTSGYQSDLSGTLENGEPVVPPNLTSFRGGHHTPEESFLTDWTNTSLTEAHVRGHGDIRPVLQGMIEAIDPAGDGSEAGVSLSNLSIRFSNPNDHTHGSAQHFAPYTVYERLQTLSGRPEIRHRNWSVPRKVLSFSSSEIVVEDPDALLYDFYLRAVDKDRNGPGWARRPHIHLRFLEDDASYHTEPLDTEYGDSVSPFHTPADSVYEGKDTTTFPVNGASAAPLVAESTAFVVGDASFTSSAA
jgi:hypothetical protein